MESSDKENNQEKIIDVFEYFREKNPESTKFKYAGCYVDAEIIDNSLKVIVELHPRVLKSGEEMKMDSWYVHERPDSKVTDCEVFDQYNNRIPDKTITRVNNIVVFDINFPKSLKSVKDYFLYKIQYTRRNHGFSVGFPRTLMFPLHFFTDMAVDDFVFRLTIPKNRFLKTKIALSDGKVKEPPQSEKNVIVWKISNLRAHELFLYLVGVKVRLSRLLAAIVASSSIGISSLLAVISKLLNPVIGAIVALALIVILNVLLVREYWV